VFGGRAAATKASLRVVPEEVEEPLVVYAGDVRRRGHRHHEKSMNQEPNSESAVDLPRLARPSHEGYWWWLPAYAINARKGHLRQWWTVVSAGPDTEKEGEFVGPLVAPIWTNIADQLPRTQDALNPLGSTERVSASDSFAPCDGCVNLQTCRTIGCIAKELEETL